MLCYDDPVKQRSDAKAARLVELRIGGVLAVASPNNLIHLRMLEELRDAGILTPDEFAAKRRLIGFLGTIERTTLGREPCAAFSAIAGGSSSLRYAA